MEGIQTKDGQGGQAMSQTPPPAGTSCPPRHCCSSTARPHSSWPSIPATYLDHTGLRPSLSQESSDTPTQSHLWQHHFFAKMLLLLTLPPFLLPSKLLIRRPDDMGRSKFQACPSAVQHRHLSAYRHTSLPTPVWTHYGLFQSQGGNLYRQGP